MKSSETYDAAFDAQLMSHLASCGRSGGYRVLEVLKRSDYEVTEKVVFAGEDGGDLGPFVRKRIDTASGLGGAYEQLFVAQRRGLRCPNLPRIADVWNDGQQINVVMEWLYGQTLEDLIAAAGPGEDLAREVMSQVTCAVEVLHAGLGQGAPVIHRDLKPSNIMVVGGTDGIPRTFVLIDLGIARTWREGAEADTARLGTRSYAPPEQFGFGQTSVRSDVYALGAILYFCLTGEDPVPGKTAAQLVSRPGMPPELASVVARAMSFDPQARYGGAAELAAAAAGEAGVAGAVAADARRPSLLGSVPDLWGRVWNTLIAGAFLVLVAACVGNFIVPTQSSLRYPTWYLGLEFLFWLPVSFAAAAWLLIDKRRIMRQLPALAAVPLGAQRLACVAAMVGSLMVVIICGLIGGAL